MTRPSLPATRTAVPWLLAAAFAAASPARPAPGQASDFALRFHGTGTGQKDRVLHLFAGREPPPPPFAECGAPGGMGCAAYLHCPLLPAG